MKFEKKIDGRRIVPEVVRMAYWIVDFPYLRQLRTLVKDKSDLRFMVKTEDILADLNNMKSAETNNDTKEMICITIVAIKLLSNMYLAEEYNNIEPMIEVCSFEEGDPQ